MRITGKEHGGSGAQEHHDSGAGVGDRCGGGTPAWWAKICFHLIDTGCHRDRNEQSGRTY
jgi:hypothetical protein